LHRKTGADLLRSAMFTTQLKSAEMREALPVSSTNLCNLLGSAGNGSWYSLETVSYRPQRFGEEHEPRFDGELHT
jgi:hypothetical protein